MTDTPETDHAHAEYPHYGDWVQIALARKLERERNSLRAVNAELLASMRDVVDDWRDGYKHTETQSATIASTLLTLLENNQSKP